jgi:hypothetical protein
MDNEYMKKCLSPLTMNDMQIKTALEFHLTLVSMAIIKKTTYAVRIWGYTVSGNGN